MRSLRAAFVIAIVVSGFSIAGFAQFGLAQDSTINDSASNLLRVQLETAADGQAVFTNETSHTSAYSAKLVIPEDAQQGSCAFALYPYNKPLSSISTVSVFASFKNAVPVFVFRLDKNGDGIAEISLMSDYPFASDSEWKDTTVGNRWGWTEAYNQLSTYGKTWNPLDYWKDQYGNATVLYIGIALEYWAMDPNGYGEPLYTDELTVNGVKYNITPASSPNPIQSLDALNVELKRNLDGQASFTGEKVHTSPNSAKLVIPIGAIVGSYAMALYPYNKPLSTLSSFSIVTSYFNATPRFVIYLDKNGDGQSDGILLSDYQFTSDGGWKVVTGGNRWGWTEANMQLSMYGAIWQQLEDWKTEYGDMNVPYVGVALEYWAVEPYGYGEPLYADELILDDVTYNIAQVMPSPSPNSNDWPMFHNDPVHSGYSWSAGPLTNQVFWKKQVGSSIESSPTVVDGVVYFGSLWNGHNGFVNALDAGTGGKSWQFATDSGVESSPAVVDGVVYIGTYGGHVYALDAASGVEIWEFNAGGSVFPSPAVVDGVVYVGSASGYMYALNAANGLPIWSYYTNGRIFASPAVVDGVVCFGSDDQNFYALRASDGAQIWNYTTGGYIDTSPTVAEGIVYFGSRDGYVYALNATDGSQIWSFRPLHGNYGSYYYSTPAVANGVIYVGGYDSYIYALNAADGSVFWQFRAGGYIFSSPIVAGTVVYVGSYDGNVYALGAITGSKIWSYQTGDKIRSSPAVVNGVVYIGSDDGYLYAFGSPNGKPDYKISGYIVDANGHGIEGANIIFNVPSIVPSVWSSSSGYYEISAPAGTYHINVWPPFDSHYIHYDEPRFVVESDTTKNITLYSGYKVSGYISFSNGTPVVGAAVLLTNSENIWFGSGWFSNSEGYYFLSVPAGTYTIDAHPRTGNYYSGPTTDFPPYQEYNFTVNCDTVKNITVGGSTSTLTQSSEPVSSKEPAPKPTPEPAPQSSAEPPANITPTQLTVSTKADTLSLLEIVLGIIIIATPIAIVISACLQFYFKKRKHSTDTRV
jgi:outer membrane protein assembly factor BamB